MTTRWCKWKRGGTVWPCSVTLIRWLVMIWSCRKPKKSRTKLDWVQSLLRPRAMRQANTVSTILGLTSSRSSGRAYTRAPIFLAIEMAYLAGEQRSNTDCRIVALATTAVFFYAAATTSIICWYWLCIVELFVLCQVISLHQLVSNRTRLNSVNEIQDWEAAADGRVLHTEKHTKDFSQAASITSLSIEA